MVAPRFTFLGVPIDSVGRAGGTEFAPDAIREASGGTWRWPVDGGDLEVSIRGDDRDPETGIVASADVLATTESVDLAVAAHPLPRRADRLRRTRRRHRVRAAGDPRGQR
jgi:arginase family enzyme